MPRKYQYLKGELDYTPDLGFVVWKKEPFISIKDLSKTTKDLVKYKELPWEAEAYKNQQLLPEKFKKSKYFKDLYQNADTTLIFVLDNL